MTYLKPEFNIGYRFLISIKIVKTLKKSKPKTKSEKTNTEIEIEIWKNKYLPITGTEIGKNIFYFEPSAVI